MKEKFEFIPGLHIIHLSGPERIVHCTRCGTEYPSTSLVFGRRDGDKESGINGWQWFCTHDNCYGRSPQDIYTVTVESA